MSSQRTCRDYLGDIVEAIDKAMQFVEGMTYDQFAADERTHYAAVRALEIIGEATKRIPDDVRRAHAEIPWREMAGMRDKLIHHYTGVDLGVVWKTVCEELPGLGERIASVLAETDA